MAKMRAPRPIRALKQAVEQRTAAPSRTEYLEDLPQQEILEQWLPQIAMESEQAAKTARVSFLYYRKKLSGRRCSCFDVETSANAECQICYGSGFVGGWDLHGCRTEWIESTWENVRLVNMFVNYDAGTRPVYFELEEGMKKGFLETEVPLIRNIGKVQAIQYIVGGKRRGTTVRVLLRSPSENSFVPLTEDSLEARLNNTHIVLRIEMERDHNQLPSPKLSHVMLRYKLLPEIEMYGDRNLAEESFELGDLGFSDIFTTLSLYVPACFSFFNNEDFLIRLDDRKRFKITRLEQNRVAKVLLSHTLRGRLLISGTDSLLNFP
jgi:hypothetical protein